VFFTTNSVNEKIVIITRKWFFIFLIYYELFNNS
jgi:hypothetical protein